WSLAAGLAYNAWRKRGGVIIGALVFSHWIFDFITHKPDLELWFGGPKVGLGLWDYRTIAVSVEFGLLLAGFMIFLRQTKGKGAGGVIAPLVLLTALAAAQLYSNFGPLPGSAAQAAQSAIAAYALFAGLAFWVDASRTAN
ncbi:hypothetical protein MNBD_ALPHA05-540, partial [hydrothermal vent metagenome]